MREVPPGHRPVQSPSLVFSFVRCVDSTFFHVNLHSVLLSSDKKKQFQGGRVHLGLQYRKGTVSHGGEGMVLVWGVWVADHTDSDKSRSREQTWGVAGPCNLEALTNPDSLPQVNFSLLKSSHPSNTAPLAGAQSIQTLMSPREVSHLNHSSCIFLKLTLGQGLWCREFYWESRAWRNQTGPGSHAVLVYY